MNYSCDSVMLPAEKTSNSKVDLNILGFEQNIAWASKWTNTQMTKWNGALSCKWERNQMLSTGQVTVLIVRVYIVLAQSMCQKMPC